MLRGCAIPPPNRVELTTPHVSWPIHETCSRMRKRIVTWSRARLARHRPGPAAQGLVGPSARVRLGSARGLHQRVPHCRQLRRRRLQETRHWAVRVFKRSVGLAARCSAAHRTAPRLTALSYITNSEFGSCRIIRLVAMSIILRMNQMPRRCLDERLGARRHPELAPRVLQMKFDRTPA